MPKSVSREIILEVIKAQREREASEVSQQIREINSRYEYEDTHPGGRRDARLVSCGQDGGYDELSYIYREKLLPFVTQRKITRDQAIAALSACCEELPNPRLRSEYYALLSDKLGVDID